MIIPNQELADLVLAWADEFEPEKAGATRALLSKPLLARRYLVRLLEIRCERDHRWRDALPLSILDLTKLRVTIRTARGQRYTVSGARADPPAQLRFSTLALVGEKFSELLDVIDTFDAEVVECSQND